jgi:hypothetical protein
VNARHWTAIAGIFLVLPEICGCVGPRLRKLEYNDLQSELSGIQQAAEYLRANPKLGTDYAARLHISGKTFNDVLAGFTGASYPMRTPKGATLTIDSVSLEPRDGAMAATVKATVTSKDKRFAVSVRMRADLETSVSVTDEGALITVKPVVKELVPTLRVSIFKFRLWWFVERLLFVKAREYTDALPAFSTALNPRLDLDLDAEERTSQIKTSDGTITIKFRSPGISRHYKYTVSRVMYLEEGAYLFMNIEDVP